MMNLFFVNPDSLHLVLTKLGIMRIADMDRWSHSSAHNIAWSTTKFVAESSMHWMLRKYSFLQAWVLHLVIHIYPLLTTTYSVWTIVTSTAALTKVPTLSRFCRSSTGQQFLCDMFISHVLKLQEVYPPSSESYAGVIAISPVFCDPSGWPRELWINIIMLLSRVLQVYQDLQVFLVWSWVHWLEPSFISGVNSILGYEC